MKKILLAILSSAVICHAFADNIPVKEGTDYTVLSGPISKPLPAKAGKVNVTEFYSYACIHCSILEPTLDKWYAGTKNVDLNRIQVVWENNFSGYAKINATAQALNLGTQFNQQVFNATMTEHKNLEDKTQLQTFLNANKSIVDPKKFMATYNSFAVSTKPQEYAQYTTAYNITGTPTFIVGNKYVTSPAQPEQLIKVIQALVDKVKKEQKIK
ncbi:MAG TPA: thiol:disulfide interchange protein DsbA/DsbL [Burkholderiales bacterium]|jgi:thiol:disulfide interchange protein DsbA|nr:thiol:disulfide interchange protein DsbA/DsbL [Burkholderiales bacterium]